MDFLVAIERGDDEHAFGTAVPDLPGCFSAGDTFEEALANTKAAIELQIEALLDAGEVPREPRPASERLADPDYAGWIWAVVSIEPEALDDSSERINISMPRRVLRAIDKAADEARKTRSGFLAEAGLALAQHRRANAA
jgi:predicted RNase H-like HicB family nuclease